jgi:hypothetical protein
MGVALAPEAYFPDLSNGFVISEERRNAEQLAATFPDPADARSRLRAWCWPGQIERVYTRGQLTIDISIHDFSGAEGAILAERWFSQQRATALGLMRDSSRSLLQRPDGSPSIVPAAFFNESEYTLFFRFGSGEILVRVTVSGERSALEADRDVIAYQVMDLIVDCGSLITPCG